MIDTLILVAGTFGAVVVLMLFALGFWAQWQLIREFVETVRALENDEAGE